MLWHVFYPQEGAPKVPLPQKHTVPTPIRDCVRPAIASADVLPQKKSYRTSCNAPGGGGDATNSLKTVESIWTQRKVRFEVLGKHEKISHMAPSWTQPRVNFFP